MHVIKCGIIGNNFHEHMGTHNENFKFINLVNELEEHGGNVFENLMVQKYWENQNPKDNLKPLHCPSPHT
jgi:hypothetical protein